MACHVNHLSEDSHEMSNLIFSENHVFERSNC